MTVKALCAYLRISRSGYYKWKNTTESKAERLNKYIMRVLKDEFIISNQRAGYRTLTMKVRRDYGLKVNHKRVRRLMRKIGIASIIRRKRRIYTVSSEQETAENILNRKFKADRPNQKWVTDVTYLSYGNGQKAYLSAVKDLYGGEIIAYEVSKKNDNVLVLNTIEKALRANPGAKPILHSDRGYQYTSYQYSNVLLEYGIQKSMSRVGKCIDNAPMESFWSHYKDEAYNGKKFKLYEDLVTSIDNYVKYYNKQRYQWKLNSLTPFEYRNQAA